MAKWTNEEVVFLQQNYLKLGAKETAQQLGRSLTSVHSKIRKVGGGRPSIGPRVIWTEKEDEFLKANYQKLSWTELTQELGRTKGAINARSNLFGIKRYVDPFPFFETWTEQSAYVIGFFAADGWAVKRGPESIRIAFGQKEPDIIYALRDVIGAGRISPKASGMYQFYIQSVKTYEWLCELFGHDVCRKSHTLQWPSVPEQYIRHFIRGAMDGDGSLMRRKDRLWEISYSTSSFDFADELAQIIFDETGISLSLGENKINVWHVRCTGIKAVCLADWLYRDATIAQERKAGIARKMIETRGRAHRSSVTDKMRAVFPHIIAGYEVA